MYISIFFFNSFPLQLVTRDQTQVPMLYSKFLLFNLFYTWQCASVNPILLIYPSSSLSFVTISLFFMSISLFLFCKQVDLCNCFRFHIGVTSYDICLSDFTQYDHLQAHPCCWKWHFPIPCVWLSNIPLYIHPTSSLSIHWMIVIQVASMSLLL